MFRIAGVCAVAAVVSLAGCSSASRSSVETQVRSIVTDVSVAADQAGTAAAETVARNIATQQGEEQFKNSGNELNGPLTCTAKVQDGVSKIAVNCTGTTKTGGAAMLSGTTNEIPGASVTSLDGQFTGTVDGKQVFSTQTLGG
jgi:hypothetical protein